MIPKEDYVLGALVELVLELRIANLAKWHECRRLYGLRSLIDNYQREILIRQHCFSDTYTCATYDLSL